MQYSEIVHKGICNTWFRDGLLQIVFPSIGCQKVPRCKMCNFGSDKRNCTAEEAVRILDSGLKFFAKTQPKYATPLDESTVGPNDGMILLLETYGSILDSKECDYLKEIFEYLNTQQHISMISRIILETHYSTVDVEKLNEIAGVLIPNSISHYVPRIYIEMGLESINTKTLLRYLSKSIELSDFANTIDALKSCNYGVIVNAILGMPGMSPSDQIMDTVRTISWAASAGADEVTVFPLNIWEGTYLWKEYICGRYNRPTYYQLISVLKYISGMYITKVYFSWYGDRQLRDPSFCLNQNVLPPDPGKEDLKFWVTALETFMSFNTYEQRRDFLHELRNVLGVTEVDLRYDYFGSVDSLNQIIKDLQSDKEKFTLPIFTESMFSQLLCRQVYENLKSVDGDKGAETSPIKIPALRIGEPNRNYRIYSEQSFESIISKEDDKHE